MRAIKLSYCDHIAFLVKDSMKLTGYEVGPVQWDLDEDGVMVSTTKTVKVTDHNGKSYTITIEEDH